ncbi:RNA polymerase sigma factor [Chitinophaga niabensis]|uniref:RNA polymerase sigma factor n=1 Tax=Chitinophaga niabensis TaxID=536979 RepID=UPI000940BBE1|nr:RNA polymerase sigma-70 factor [Chitinophaga niabensis]
MTDKTIQYDEAALIAGLHRGSEQAFEMLWQHFYKRVLYFSRRFVPETDAQDITTEVFVQLWNKRADFHTIGKVANFLFIAVRNRCYNLVRDRQIHDGHIAELAELMENDRGDLLLEQVRVELVKLISEQVRQLPEKTRRVFLLSFEEGLKPSQIAERLGVSVKTVKNQKLSAIKLLKSALQQHPLESVLLFLLEIEYFFSGQ